MFDTITSIHRNRRKKDTRLGHKCSPAHFESNNELRRGSKKRMKKTKKKKWNSPKYCDQRELQEIELLDEIKYLQSFWMFSSLLVSFWIGWNFFFESNLFSFHIHFWLHIILLPVFTENASAFSRRFQQFSAWNRTIESFENSKVFPPPAPSFSLLFGIIFPFFCFLPRNFTSPPYNCQSEKPTKHVWKKSIVLNSLCTEILFVCV